MEHSEVTTTEVAAQHGCAFAPLNSFIGVGAIDQQPAFAPVTRRDLMAAINTAGRDLGLRPSTVVVLDALLSCLPCNNPKTGGDSPITPLTLLTVFACNDTLCFRAKGITDRQLRRHLVKLESLNLIQRRDSANGKRFPILRKGQVIGAFGIDLSPLLARSGEIIALARKHREQADELRGMKAFILKLRQECCTLDLQGEALSFVENVRNLTRRAGVTLRQAQDVIRHLKALLEAHGTAAANVETEALALANDHAFEEKTEQVPAQISGQETATDGQNVRHKETQKSYTKKTMPQSLERLWTSLTVIPSFYPEHPRSEHTLLQLLFEFGRMLRIDGALLAKAITLLGVAEVLKVADQIASKADQIKSPDGYLSKILSGALPQKVGHGQPEYVA